MKQHKTFFGKIFGTAWDSIKGFFSDLFEKADHDILQFVILATNEIKQGLQTGIIPVIVGMTETTKDDDLLAIANENLDKVIADAAILSGLSPTSTAEDFKAIAAKVLASFGVMADDTKAQLYTTISAKLYILYMKKKHNVDVSFGKAASLAEAGWQEFQASKAAA